MQVWTTETAKRERCYCDRITDAALSDNPRKRDWALQNYSGDLGTLRRYLEMQARALVGYAEDAAVVQRCADDVLLAELAA